jgi:hypothetical protein
VRMVSVKGLVACSETSHGRNISWVVGLPRLGCYGVPNSEVLFGIASTFLKQLLKQLSDKAEAVFKIVW